MSYHYNYNRNLVKFSKENRKNYTDAEKLLWFFLRNRQVKGYKFRRQFPILNYILDFYFLEKKLAIELDGSQHIQQAVYDKQRDKQLKKLGISVMRFWDNDILQKTEDVLEQIVSWFENDSVTKPHPGPLLKGEGERRGL